jgi:broad specificity phosphatase PhoE
MNSMMIFAKALRPGVFLLALSLLTACAETGMPWDKPASDVTTTVIMVRHAERPSFGDVLTEAGRARAAALPAAVKGYDIAAIYSPDKQRNRDTARPLAAARGLEVKIVNEWDGLYHILRDHPGKVAVWVGNSGNLAQYHKDLEAPGRAPLGYGDLFVYEVRDGKAVKVTERHFGK